MAAQEEPRPKLRRHSWKGGDTCLACGVERSGVALHGRYGGVMGVMYYRRPGAPWTTVRPACTPEGPST